MRLSLEKVVVLRKQVSFDALTSASWDVCMSLTCVNTRTYANGHEYCESVYAHSLLSIYF